MDDIKKYLFGFLLVLITATSIYITYEDEFSNVRFRFDKDKTTAYTLNEYNRYVIAGQEYVKLFSGTRLNYRDLSSTKVELSNLSEDRIMVVRTTEYKGSDSKIVQTYMFDSENRQIEKFPLTHQIEVFNSKGKIIQYEVRRLACDYETTNEFTSPVSFGNNMKVEWDYGNYYQKIYKYVGQNECKIIIKYKIESDYEVINARLYDPKYVRAEKIQKKFEKKCSRGVCHATINNYEIDLIIDQDEELPVWYGGSNGTHFFVQYVVKNDTEKEEKDIELKESYKNKTIKKEEKIKTKKEDYIFERAYSIDEFIREENSIQWGNFSTHLNVSVDSGLIKDDNFDNDSDSAAGDSIIQVNSMSDAGNPDGFAVVRFGYDLSQLPDNASIESVELQFYRPSGDAGATDIEVWGSDNYSWIEGSYDDIYGANQPCTDNACAEVMEKMNTLIMTGDYYNNLIAGSPKININETALTTYFNDSFYDINKNITIIFNISSAVNQDFGSTEWSSGERTAALIVYSEIEEEAPVGDCNISEYYNFHDTMEDLNYWTDFPTWGLGEFSIVDFEDDNRVKDTGAGPSGMFLDNYPFENVDFTFCYDWLDTTGTSYSYVFFSATFALTGDYFYIYHKPGVGGNDFYIADNVPVETNGDYDWATGTWYTICYYHNQVFTEVIVNGSLFVNHTNGKTMNFSTFNDWGLRGDSQNQIYWDNFIMWNGTYADKPECPEGEETIPPNGTTITWNATANTNYTNSNFTGDTTVIAVSTNESTHVINFFENSTKIYSLSVSNNTAYYINLTNLTVGINNYHWQSAINNTDNVSLNIEELPEREPLVRNSDSYSMGNYFFWIDSTTGAPYNFTYVGQNDMFMINMTQHFRNAVDTRYTITNVAKSVHRNNTHHTIFKITGDLNMSGTQYGNFTTNLKCFKNDDSCYWETTTRAESRNITIYRQQVLFYPNSDETFYEKDLGGQSNYALDGTGTVYKNTTIDTSEATNTYDYIRGVTTSYGGFAFGTIDKQRAGLISSGLYKEWSPTYLIADRYDTNEDSGNDDRPYDYVLGYQNKTFLYHDTTVPYAEYWVDYDAVDVSHARAGYELEPKQDRCADDTNCAQSFARTNGFLFFINDTDDMETTITTIDTGAEYIQGEVSMIGTRKFDGMKGLLANRNSAGNNEQYINWMTQTHLYAEMDETTNIWINFHTDFCYSRIEQLEADGGWFAYDPIVAASYGYFPQTTFGNAYNGMDSCYEVLDSTLLSTYTDMLSDIRNRSIQAVNDSLNVNTGDLIDRTKTSIITIEDDYHEFNMTGSHTRNREFYSTATQGGSGAWQLYTVPVGASTTNPIVFAIYKIDCNDSTGANLWEDNFTTDNSSNYAYYGGGKVYYDGDLDAMIINGTNGGAGYFLRPTGAVTDYTWSNYTCKFVYGILNNFTFSDDAVGAYLSFYMRYNGTNTRYTRYQTIGTNSKSSSMTGSGGTHETTWARWNWTEGLYSNYWGEYGVTNDSAWMGRWEASLPTESASSGYTILNIQMYYSLYLATAVRDADLLGESAMHIDYHTRLKKVVQGLDFWYKAFPILVRWDGFLGYGKSNPTFKDDSYFYNYFWQVSKMIRALLSQDTKVKPIPFACWYIRYPRHNASESYSTASFEQALGFIGAVDTRCTWLMENKDSYTAAIGEDNKILSLYSDEYNNGYELYPSNKSDTFGNRTGIAYKDNHLKYNWSTGVSYGINETDTNARLTDWDGNIMIQDAYQIYEGDVPTNDVMIFADLIQNVTYVCSWWYEGDQEAGPFCNITSYTNWSKVDDAWKPSSSLGYRNSTQFNWDSGSNGSSRINWTMRYFYPSTIGHVYINGSQNISDITTGADGTLNFNFTIVGTGTVNITFDNVSTGTYTNTAPSTPVITYSPSTITSTSTIEVNASTSDSTDKNQTLISCLFYVNGTETSYDNMDVIDKFNETDRWEGSLDAQYDIEVNNTHYVYGRSSGVANINISNDVEDAAIYTRTLATPLDLSKYYEYGGNFSIGVYIDNETLIDDEILLSFGNDDMDNSISFKIYEANLTLNSTWINFTFDFSNPHNTTGSYDPSDTDYFRIIIEHNDKQNFSMLFDRFYFIAQSKNGTHDRDISILNITPSNTEQHDNISVKCRAYDNASYSSWSALTYMWVTGTVPSVDLVTLVPSPINSTHNISFTNTTTDVNGDTPTAWSIKWYVNGTLNTTFHNLTQINYTYTNLGDIWVVSLAAKDQDGWSDYTNSSSETIIAVSPGFNYSYGSGISSIIFRPYNTTHKYLAPTGQTSTISTYIVCNNGTGSSIDGFEAKLNTTLHTNITAFLGNSSNYSDINHITVLNTTYKYINGTGSVGVGVCNNVWYWLNFSGGINKTLYYDILWRLT